MCTIAFLAPPKTYPEAVNLTADNSLPYILTGGFRPVSSIPELAHNVTYTKYRIVLLLPDREGFIQNGIDDNSVTEVFVDEVGGCHSLILCAECFLIERKGHEAAILNVCKLWVL